MGLHSQAICGHVLQLPVEISSYMWAFCSATLKEAFKENLRTLKPCRKNSHGQSPLDESGSAFRRARWIRKSEARHRSGTRASFGNMSWLVNCRTVSCSIIVRCFLLFMCVWCFLNHCYFFWTHFNPTYTYNTYMQVVKQFIDCLYWGPPKLTLGWARATRRALTGEDQSSRYSSRYTDQEIKHKGQDMALFFAW